MPSTSHPDEGTEIEWQFDALDLRPVERWLAALPSRPTGDLPTLTVLAKTPQRLVDRYFDTDDRRIGQAGLVLRVRRKGGSAEATMKDTRPAGAGGLRRRLEVTEALPPGGLSALSDRGPVGRRLAAVVGNRPLVDLLEIRTSRKPFSLRAAGEELAEVALDETVILVGNGERPVHLRRVEVEVAPEWVDALTPVVEDLRAAGGLQPATLSKFEAGSLAAGIEVPGPPDVGPTEVGPESSTGDVAFAVVRRHLRVLLAKEAGTRLGDDIEELHDMRVATRRLRAAVDLFSEVLPPHAQQLREELQWLAGVLGAVRDLDVQLDRMDDMEQWAQGWGDPDRDPLEHLRTLLERQRVAARRDLLSALDSARWASLTDALVSMARRGPDPEVPAAGVPAVIAVPPLVSERHRAVASAARRARKSGQASDYHRLRIRCKRLRYSLEFTTGLYGSGMQRFVRKLARLQDALGLMQDAEVASARLYQLATVETGSGALPAATVFVMGNVAAHYRRESVDLRHAMARHLKLLTGRTWSEVVETMERARERAAAVLAASADLAAATHIGSEQANPAMATTERAAAGTGVPRPSVTTAVHVPSGAAPGPAAGGNGSAASNGVSDGSAPADDAATRYGDAPGGAGSTPHGDDLGPG